MNRAMIARELVEISKSLSRQAGAGMSDSAFKGRVRRLMQKIARKYGGTVRGLTATGITEDGTEWTASIFRQNASNGEVAGRLDLSVVRGGRVKTFSSFWDWDKLFDEAGISSETSGRISSDAIMASIKLPSSMF